MSLFSPSRPSLRTLLWSGACWMSLWGALPGGEAAEQGRFIIPSIRAGGGSDFAYWDYFDRAPGTANSNYNYANPPALLDNLDRLGLDEDGNPTTVLEDEDNNPQTPPTSRASLTQTGARDAFMTSSGAIYSFAEVTAFRVDYQPDEETPGAVTNVIFQTQTGGMRLDVNSVELVCQQAGVPVRLQPVYRGLDDPQSGEFSERIVCAFQWDLTGLNVRNFQIEFSAPDISMPLWEAQLDVAVGGSFQQELGYILQTRSRPGVRFNRAGAVDKNLHFSVDGRYFLEGDELNLLGDPATGWRTTGWHMEDTVTRGSSFPLIFPARDVTVTALFAPEDYATWRNQLFYHFNSTLGTTNEHLDDTVSGPEIDHDGDGLTNAGEYAFAGDPYNGNDQARTRPQYVLVEHEGQTHAAIRYRSNGLAPGLGDVEQTVRMKANGGTWQTGQSVLVERALQPDGSELVTERTPLPLSQYTSLEMDVAWSVDGMPGTPQAPAALAITTAALASLDIGGDTTALALEAEGGLAPYAWSLANGSLPDGLMLNEDGTLTGSPAAVGSFTFTAQVSDSLFGEVSREFTMVVRPFDILTAATLPARAVGAPFSVSLSRTGGTAPFAWAVSEGDLPEGVVLSAEGVLSGTPAETGVFGFTVQVTGAGGFSASKVLTLTVFDLAITTQGPLPTAISGVPYQTDLAYTGGTAPLAWTVTFGSLPPGLSLADGRISGTPGSAGNYTFTVRLTDNDGFNTSRTLSLEVLAKAPPPVLDAVNFAAVMVGSTFEHTVTAANAPEKFVIKGLPKGVKYNNRTGEISGRPSKAAAYPVQITASNKSGSSATVTATLDVLGVPEMLLGKFMALAERDAQANGGLGSLIDLTTTTTGAFTVKVNSGGSAKSAKGFLSTGAPQVTAVVNGQLLELTLDENTGLVSGSYGAAEAEGWQIVWDRKNRPLGSREGYYGLILDLADGEDLGEVSIPQGAGFASFTLVSAGTLKLKGRTADGQAITCATALGPQGQMAVYVPMYQKKGSLAGKGGVSAGETPADNRLSGALTWLKPVTKGRQYAGAFGPVPLVLDGAWLGTATKRKEVLGLPEAGEFELRFSSAGIEASETVADVTGAVWTDKFKADLKTAANAGKATVKISKTTGAVTGGLTLEETAPVKLKRKVKFLGQTVRTADGSLKAAGYFLLPQIPGASEKPATAPILSGLLELVQPEPAPAP